MAASNSVNIGHKCEKRGRHTAGQRQSATYNLGVGQQPHNHLRDGSGVIQELVAPAEVEVVNLAR
ncbi:MAG: hypothetical protein ACK55I_25340 [bacterium]